MNPRLIIKKLIPVKLFRRIEPYGHLVEAIIANLRYGFPARSMHFIGVTGTNGKTTTTFLIHKMLTEAGFKVGFLSTVAYGIGEDIKPQIQHMTTEKAGILQRRLKQFKKAGVQWVVLESSSHALAQYRTWGVPYEIVVMTNVTNDHLDYHGTFDRYLTAKLRLFKIASRHPSGFGVVNADDSSATKFIRLVKQSMSYGIKDGQLRAKDIKLNSKYSTFKAEVGERKYKIKINIPGDYNVSNALAAVAVGQKIGLTPKQIEEGIESLKSVEGRMASIEAGQDYSVIIDFASTPDAFERVLSNIRPLTKGKLIILFGSAGRRDESKRAVQGEIAGRLGDEVVITEEDDRDSDGQAILQQIATGAKKAGKILDKNLFLVHDRTKAIEFAISRVASANDTVVLLGKGHEKTIEGPKSARSWNEFETAKKAILKKSSSAKTTR